jgi:hypothetical protein
MPAIEDKISLQEKFSSYQGDILEGLRMAEPTWNASEIFQSLETAIRSDRAVTETFFSLGQRFEWMIFRPQGRVGIVRNVEWAGKGNLEGFLIAIAYKNEEIKFFIAKRCGNLALVEKKPAPPPPKVEAPPPPKAETPPPPPPEYQPRVYVDVCPPPPPVIYYSPPPPPFIFFGGGYGYHYHPPRHYYYPPPRIHTRPPAPRIGPPGVRTR